MSSILNFFTENFWATATSLGVVATMVAGAINGKLHTNKVWRQVVAWAVSIVFTVGGYFLGMINVAEPAWLTLTATGLVVGLTSNGIYDIPVIQDFIARVFGEKPNDAPMLK